MGRRNAEKGPSSTRIEEAKKILEAMGMPHAQRNDNAAYTLVSIR